ncbi:MAG: hypothetical protein UHK52_03055 [Bacteroidales bacterium]|nr:hypothetical protein [Bacteroidales bacterium]
MAVYKKLQDLTETALGDGVLTEREEAILIAKAKEMGQDLSEFMIYLEDAKQYRAKVLAEREKKRQELENRPVYVKLAEKITSIETGWHKDDDDYQEKEIQKALSEVVNPSDQEGLFQLTNYLFSKYTQSEKHSSCKSLYKRKFEECLNSGLLSFPSDERFKNLNEALKEQKEKEKKEFIRMLIIAGCAFAGIMIFCAIMSVISD